MQARVQKTGCGSITNPDTDVYFSRATPTGTPPTVPVTVQVNVFEAGLTVELYGDTPEAAPCSILLTTVPVSGQSVNLPNVALPANALTMLRVIVKDSAGNTSGCTSNTLQVTADSVAPAAPVLIEPTGRSNNQNPNVTGTPLGASESGDVVYFFSSAACAGKSTCAEAKVAAKASQFAAGDGAFGTQVAAPHTTPAAGASNTFSVLACDPAGNASPCSNDASYVLDSQAPSPPLFVAFVVDGVPTAGNTNTSATPAVKGTSEEGATVQLYTDVNCAIPAGGTATGQGTVAGSDATRTGTFEIPVAVQATEGTTRTTSFYAKATDMAGNTTQACTFLGTYTCDRTPVLSPRVTDSLPHPAGWPVGTGRSVKPTVTGSLDSAVTGTKTGWTAALFLDAQCGTPATLEQAALPRPPATGLTAADGTFSIQVDGSALGTDWQARFYARVRDLSGNWSPCSSTFAEYDADNKAPTAPTLVKYAYAAPFLASPVAAPTVTGTVDENGLTVWLYKGACPATACDPLNAGQVGRVTTPAPSAWPVAAPPLLPLVFDSVAVNATQPTSTHPGWDDTTLFAQALDPAGNCSACSTVSYEYDGWKPTGTATIVGISAFGNTHAVTPTMYYSSDQPAPIVTILPSDLDTFRILLFGTADCQGAPMASSGWTDLAGNPTEWKSGSATLQAPALTDSQTVVFSTASVDRAGNLGPCNPVGNQVRYTYDTRAPSTPTVVLDPSSCPIQTPQQCFPKHGLGNGVFPNSPALTVTGAPEYGTVKVFVGTTAADCIAAKAMLPVTADAAGSVSVPIDIDRLAQPTTTTGTVNPFMVQVVTAAGVAGPCISTGVTFNYDNKPPTILVAGSPAFTPPSPSNSTTPNVNGMAEQGSLVQLYTDSVCLTKAQGTDAGFGQVSGSTPPATGTFSIPVVVPAADAGSTRSTAFWAKVTDLAGNTTSGCYPLATYVNDQANANDPSMLSIGNSWTRPSDWKLNTVWTGKNQNPLLSCKVTVGCVADWTHWFVDVYTDSSCTQHALLAGGGGANAHVGGSSSCLFTIPVDGSVFGPDPLNWDRKFWFQSTNPAGNKSQCVGPVEYACDNTAPAAPVLAPSTYAAPFVASSVATPTVTGTAAEYGMTVWLYKGTCPNTCTNGAANQVGRVTSSAPSMWPPESTTAALSFPSVAVTTAKPAKVDPGWDDTPLVAQAQDMAGNCGPCTSATAYQYDAWAPAAAPTITNISLSTGTFSVTETDYYSSDKPDPIVTLLPSDGDTFRVYLYQKDNCQGDPIVSNGWTSAGSPTEWKPSDGSVDIHVPALTSPASITLSARSVDRAGNVGTCNALNNRIRYTYDTRVPATAPVVTLDPVSCPVAGKCTDTSGVGNALPPNTPTLRATDVPAYGKLKIFVNSSTCATGTLAAVQAGADGVVAAPYVTVTSGLVPGTNRFYAKVISAAGVESTTCWDTGVSFILDTTPPGMAVFNDPPLYIPDGTPAKLAVLKVNGKWRNSAKTAYVDVLAENGSTVALFKADPQCLPASKVATGSVPGTPAGSSSIKIEVTPDSGSAPLDTSFYARVTDWAGNAGTACVGPVTYTFDNRAPWAPVWSQIGDGRPKPAGWAHPKWWTGRAAGITLEGSMDASDPTFDPDPAGLVNWWVNVYTDAGCTTPMQKQDGKYVKGNPQGSPATVTLTFDGSGLSGGVKNWTQAFYARTYSPFGTWGDCTPTPLVYVRDNTAPAVPSIKAVDWYVDPFVASIHPTTSVDCDTASEWGLTYWLYSGSLPMSPCSDGNPNQVGKAIISMRPSLDLPAPTGGDFAQFFSVPVDTATPSTTNPGWNDTALHVATVDLAGNCSSGTVPLTYLYDNWPPTVAPTFQGISAGYSPASGKYFSSTVAMPTVSVQPHDGDTFRVYLFKGVPAGTTDCSSGQKIAVSAGWKDGSGNPREWVAADGPVPLQILTPLDSGAATGLTWASVDRAGSLGPCDTAGITYTFDSAAPPVPGIARSVGQPLWGKTAPTVTLSTVPYARVEIYASATGCDGLPITPVPATDSTGIGVFDVTVPASSLAPGENHLWVKAFRPDGTQGTCSSGSAIYDYDTVGPASPTIATVTKITSRPLTVLVGAFVAEEPMYGEAAGTTYVFTGDCPASGVGGAATTMTGPAVVGAEIFSPVFGLGAQPAVPTQYHIRTKAVDALGNEGPCGDNTWDYFCQLGNAGEACTVNDDCCAGKTCRSGGPSGTSPCRDGDCTLNTLCNNHETCCKGNYCKHPANGSAFTNGSCGSSCRNSGDCQVQTDCCIDRTCRTIGNGDQKGNCVASQTCGVSGGSCTTSTACCYPGECRTTGHDASGNPYASGSCGAGDCGPSLYNPDGGCSSDPECCLGYTCRGDSYCGSGQCKVNSSTTGACSSSTGDHACCKGVTCRQSTKCLAGTCLAAGGTCSGTDTCCMGTTCRQGGKCQANACSAFAANCNKNTSCCFGLACHGDGHCGSTTCLGEAAGTCTADSDCCWSDTQGAASCRESKICLGGSCIQAGGSCGNNNYCCIGNTCHADGKCYSGTTCGGTGATCANNAGCCMGKTCLGTGKCG